MNETKAYWQEQLLSKLPPEESIRARNAAINASYARWFQRHPDWFRWAGMAAFASSRIGLLLAVYDYAFLRGDAFSSGATSGGLFNDARIINSLETIRQANNNVFANAGWAHLAYESPDGGIEAVEAGLKDDADSSQQFQLEGFRLIDRARKMQLGSEADRKAAEEMFWQGNLLLLKNEQWGVVEQHFSKLDLPLGLGLTITTSLDFDATHLVRDEKTYCEFYSYMWRRGLLKLISTFSLPDITLLAHRWLWVENLVFPTWKRVVTTDLEISKKMMRIVKAAVPFDPEVYNPNRSEAAGETR
ncbi:MAG TPA: hypothetical protein VF721_15600 [Pyrinomonadaceae bacterium]